MTEPEAARALRVYHLEDNPLLAMFVKELIEELGHRCVGCCESYAEFRSKADGMQYDCVLIDIDLADGRTGPEAARWLKEQGTPVVFVTGQEQVARQHAHLVHACLPKPISPRKLKTVLNEIASGAKAG